MGLFDLFKSKKRRELEYFELILDISTKVFEIIKKKKEYSDIGAVDYSFDKNMFDKLFVLNYYKAGALDFMDEEYRNTIIRVFQSSEFLENDYKNDINNSFHYLRSFTNSMKETVKNLKENL